MSYFDRMKDRVRHASDLRINGVIAVPIMFATMHIVSTRRGRETFGVPAWLCALGWLATALMGVTVAALAWLNLV